MFKVAYYNPQSYSNLEKYDVGVLSEFVGQDGLVIDYYCNRKVVHPPANTQVYRVFNYSDRKLPERVFFYILGVVQFFVGVLKIRSNIVHVQWMKMPFFECFVFLFLKLFLLGRIRIVYTAHNLYPHDSSILYRMFYKYIYFFFDHIFCHDEDSKSAIRKIIKHDKITVVGHGLIPFECRGEVSKDVETITGKYGGKIVLAIGGGSRYKSSDLLEASWEASGVYKQGYVLVVAGKGVGEFIESSDKRAIIVIDRFLSESELRVLSSAAHCFLLPYREISQSGVLLSILEYRKPMLLTYRGALKEFVDKFSVAVYLHDITMLSIADGIRRIAKYSDGEDYVDWPAVMDFYAWQETSDVTLRKYVSIVKGDI
jgi:hypothetical protein